MNHKDIASGALFVLLGASYGGMALTTLTIGSARNMGPGYFPIVLGGVLVGLGLAISLRGCFTGHGSPFGPIPWRGIIVIPVAMMLFAVFLNDLGLLPGIFLLTFISSCANPKVNLFKAGAVSLSIALFCTLVFAYGVRLPVQVIGPLFGVVGLWSGWEGI